MLNHCDGRKEPRTDSVNYRHPTFRRDKAFCDECRYCCTLPFCSYTDDRGGNIIILEPFLAAIYRGWGRVGQGDLIPFPLHIKPIKTNIKSIIIFTSFFILISQPPYESNNFPFIWYPQPRFIQNHSSIYVLSKWQKTPQEGLKAVKGIAYPVFGK